MQLARVLIIGLAISGTKATCLSEGKCADSKKFLQTVPAANLCDCYAQCHFLSDCISYSYNRETRQCDQFSAFCSNLDTEECQQCVSGEQACAPEECVGDKCLINFRPVSKPVQVSSTNDLCECKSKCSSHGDGCIYYSFDSSNNECTHYPLDNGTGGAEECDDCLTGTYFCQPEQC